MTDLEWVNAKSLAGMKPWACSCTKDGRRFAITLYGSDAEQVLNDNCAELSELCVDGELICTALADTGEDG